jgi:hypothetical protein
MEIDAMEPQDILRRLESNDGTFPRGALQDAIAQREQIIPHLLTILHEAERHAQDLLERENYMAHIYAMYLLAQFREHQAYPCIVAFFSLPGKTALDLTGDVVTEDLHRILASVSCGDVSLIRRLAENERADAFVRGAAFERFCP